MYFPIAHSQAKYEDRQKKDLKGATKAAITAVDAIKPYKGGNDTLWLLHALNNIDKHRLLIATASAFRSFDVGAHMHRLMQSTIGSSPDWEGVELPQDGDLPSACRQDVPIAGWR